MLAQHMVHDFCRVGPQGALVALACTAATTRKSLAIFLFLCAFVLSTFGCAASTGYAGSLATNFGAEPRGNTPTVNAVRNNAQLPKQSFVSASQGAQNTNTQNFDDTNTIRIGFFYLDATLEAVSIQAMHDALVARIAQANTALINSDINGQFVFNHLSPWPHNNHASFHDIDARTTYNAMAPTIENLTQSGYLARYGIDIALLVDYRVEDPYCGWASINTLADLTNAERTRSYGLLRLGPGCGLDSLALIHELGHLFGAGHGLGDSVIPSDPRGHGYVCNDKHTIMHTRHAKHLFFSSPWKEANGDLCGRQDQANVQALITERFPLLAQRNSTPRNSANVQISMRNGDTPGAVTLTFERFGWVDSDAHFDFHLDSKRSGNTNINSNTDNTLHRITFAPGELVQTYQVILDPGTIETTTILVINPDNIDLPFRTSTLGELNAQSALVIGYRQEALTVRLEFSEEVASLASRELVTWSAVTVDWQDGTLSDEEDFDNPRAITHTYNEIGIYTIQFSGYDPEGVFQERSLTVNVGTDTASSHNTPSLIPAENNSNASSNASTDAAASSTGGTVNISLILISLVLMFFRKKKKP